MFRTAYRSSSGAPNSICSLCFIYPCGDRPLSSWTTKKMQPCNRIYYSKIYWRLNMFRAAYRSSSGAPNCICSLWFIYPCGDRPLSSWTTKKMQPCNRIYYSKIYWRLNMFRAAHRSSSGALNCICNLWFIYPCGDRPLSSWTTKRCNLAIEFIIPKFIEGSTCFERHTARKMLSLQ